MKYTKKDKLAIALVCKETGLTEAELISLLKKGATENIILAASVIKKNKLGRVRI